jgi:hypothetical protein
MLWQEIVRWESVKFVADLEHFINLVEAPVLNRSKFAKIGVKLGGVVDWLNLPAFNFFMPAF